MSQLQIDQVLSQIRSLAAQTQSPAVRPAALIGDAAAALGHRCGIRHRQQLRDPDEERP